MFVLSKRKTSELKLLEDPVRDSAFYELEALIRKWGLKQPLLVSKDNYIVDGGRRYVILEQMQEETIDVLSLMDDYEVDALKELRAILHYGHRNVCLSEIKRVCGQESLKPLCNQISSRKKSIEQIISDLFCAQGLGPRILMNILNKAPLIYLADDDEELQDELDAICREIEEEDGERF